MSVMLVITSCNQKQYAKLRPKINHILKEQIPSLDYFFVVGGGVGVSYDSSTKILTVPCDDGYLALPKKLFLTFKWIHQIFPDRSVIKVDDNALEKCLDWVKKTQQLMDKKGLNYTGQRWVDVPKAARDIKSTSLANYYLKHHPKPIFNTTTGNRYARRKGGNTLRSTDGKYVCQYTGGWFAGGEGYYLSASALTIIVNYFEGADTIKEIYEDKLWADILLRLNRSTC